MNEFLPKIWLYKDISITRDYSVVHDLTRYQWSVKLNSMSDKEIVDGVHVNFYRLPGTFRLQMKWEDARKAVYGRLLLQNVSRPSVEDKQPYFFWIDSVRLVTKGAVTEYDESSVLVEDYEDVVEFTVSEDVWSNYHEYAQLKDSYILRRHMPRWDSEGKPIYYPDAAQGVEGAYTLEKDEDLTPLNIESASLKDYDIRFILVSVLTPGTTGKLTFYIGADVVHNTSELEREVRYWNGTAWLPFIRVGDILNGTFYSDAGISAEYVQSVVVLPYLMTLQNCLRPSDEYSWLIFDSSKLSSAGVEVEKGSSTVWLKLTSGIYYSGLSKLMKKMTTEIGNSVPVQQETTETEHSDTGEPMLYHLPARQRKVVNGMGGGLFDVPDIAAFETQWTVENSIDTSSATTVVYPGDSALEANAIGALGTVDAPTLPIYESAWRTYVAISKTGDDISYNATQVSNAVNGIVGVITSIAGAFAGGLGGTIAGAVGGSSAASSITGLYTTSKELQAKRTTIKNSACNVVSSGSGLGAFIHKWIDIRLVVLKIDEVSFEKLSDQYYFYGYFINKTERGTVDLHTRTMFDFIQTSGARVTGDAPADALQEISAIFDKGVTIYHDYDMIGTGKTYANNEYVPPESESE